VPDSEPAVAKSESLGVVEPMRVPGADRARRTWDALPRLSQVFVALVGLDIVVRAVGLFDTTMFLDIGQPLAVISSFLPHDALILLPAIIVYRRPDALAVTPNVVRGAIVIALIELLGRPLRGVVSGNAVDPISGPTIVAIAAAIGTAWGWVLIANELRAFIPAEVAPQTRGLANLIAGAIALDLIVGGVAALLSPGNVGNPAWTTLISLNSLVAAVAGLAFAYLARVVVLGTDDRSRPSRATSLATTALALHAFGAVLLAIITTVALVQGSFGTFAGGFATNEIFNAIYVGIAWLAGPIAITAFVVAFGLGLADPRRLPSGTIGPAVQTREPVQS
jgi:hypothetical protein